MSFLKREDMYDSRPVLGGCLCSSHRSMPNAFMHHGEGVSDVMKHLEKVINPITASTISKVVNSLPNVIETVKNISSANPMELNKNIEDSIKEGHNIEQIIRKINNKKGTGLKGKQMLDRQQQMILHKLLNEQKVGSGVQIL